jgi:hypothetical protein
MNETNRLIIVLVAAATIVLMGVFIFLAWTQDSQTVNRLGDFVQYLDEHRTDSGRVIVTLSALVVAVLALLVIVLELAPEDESRELRVEQAGATTIVPAEALKLRLQEALLMLPHVSAARARVSTRNRGIATALDLTLTPAANVAQVTQEASRIVIDTIQTDLGLPVSGQPTVRVSFGGKDAPAAASSVSRPPEPPPVPASGAMTDRPPETPAQDVTTGASPGPMSYEPPSQEGEQTASDVPPPHADEQPSPDHP